MMLLDIITDDIALFEELSELINDQIEGVEAVLLSSVQEIKRAADNGGIRLAFIDSDFRKEDPFSIVRLIRIGSPCAGTIMIAKNDGLAAEAYAAHVQGYVIRPASAERIKDEIDYIRDHFVIQQKNHKGIEVMTKGPFECFIDGIPVRFKRKKAKTVISYLVSKEGAMVSTSELMKVLWGDDCTSQSEQKLKSMNSNIRTIRAEIETTFRNAGYPEVLRKNWGEMAINMDKIKFID